MAKISILRPKRNLISIPVNEAVYCESCETVSNSTRQRCGVCGSESVRRLTALIDGPPSGPDSGPAPAGCIVPALRREVARAA